MRSKPIRVLMIIAAVLLLFCIYGNLCRITMGLEQGLGLICTICLILTCLFGVFYVASGYSKPGAAYFTVFMALYGLSDLLSAAQLFLEQNSLPVALLQSLLFVCLLVLAVAKDPGQSKSVTVAAAGLLCALIAIVVAFFGAAVSSPLELIRPGTLLVLAFSSFLMVFAKYDDKKARGSK